MAAFVSSAASIGGSLGAFLSRFYLSTDRAKGISESIAVAKGTRTPFPCGAPFALVKRAVPRSGRGRQNASRSWLMEKFLNIYSGCMSWLAIGRPDRIRSLPSVPFTSVVTKVTQMALDSFASAWKHLCRGDFSPMFTGGRNPLAAELRQQSRTNNYGHREEI